MSNDYNAWRKNKNFKSKVEVILRKFDEALSGTAEETRRGRERISFGEINPKKSLVILIWLAKSVKVQVNTKYYSGYSRFGFVAPGIKEHGEKGFMELRINDALQFNEELKNFLIKGLK